jgi:tripartite-type tricarboxylate transporter receptor subunit TctC
MGDGGHLLAMSGVGMRFGQIVRLVVSIAFAAPWAASDGIAAEPATAPFYAGKQVSLLIGYPPGGGYDAYARLFARYIGAHIPGKPSVVASNMPGAGSLILANHLYNRAAKDGTVIGMVNGEAALSPLFGQADALFDSLKLSWIGSISQETSICLVWHSAAIAGIKDVLRNTLVIGAASATGTTYNYPNSSNHLLGTKFKIVAGYEGTNAVMLAVERGEVQGMCGTPLNSLRSARPQWLEQKQAKVILQEATARHPDLSDVPTVMELAPDGETKRVLELIYGWQIMGRPIVAPPGLPAERFTALRQAFDDTMKDPDFLAAAQRSILEINPINGPAIESFLIRVYRTPKALVERAAEALGRANN